MKFHGKRERKNVFSVVRRPFAATLERSAIEISASRWSPIINRIVSERSLRAATCESISTTGPRWPRMQIRGESHERKGSLGSSCPSPSSLFHLPSRLFSLRSPGVSASRAQRALLSGRLQAGVTKKRETPFCILSSLGSHLPRLIR